MPWQEFSFKREQNIKIAELFCRVQTKIIIDKTKAKPTLSLSTSVVGKAKHLSSIPTDHGEVTDKVNDKVETTY